MNNESLASEIGVLHNMIDLWWANRRIHEGADQADVGAVLDRLRDRARRSTHIWEYAAALRDELWSLGDGHLRLGPSYRGVERQFRSALHFTEVQEGVALSSPEKPSVGAFPGDLVVQIDGLPTDTYLATVRLQPGSTPAQRRWLAVRALNWQERLPHEEPAPRNVTLKRPGGEHYTLDLDWHVLTGKEPPPPCVESVMEADNIYYLAIRSFSCRNVLNEVSDAEFRRQVLGAAESIAGAEHLIVDLRQNGGGRDQQAQMAAGLFAADSMEWFSCRHATPYSETTSPVERVYLEPQAWSMPVVQALHLWLLIGPGCFSTAEIFASALRQHDHVTLVGGPTAGGVGNPLAFRLPYSGLVVMIPVAEFFAAGSDQRRLEATGHAPDLPVIQTTADLRAGQDTVRLRALRAIAEMGHEHRDR